MKVVPEPKEIPRSFQISKGSQSRKSTANTTELAGTPSIAKGVRQSVIYDSGRLSSWTVRFCRPIYCGPSDLTGPGKTVRFCRSINSGPSDLTDPFQKTVGFCRLIDVHHPTDSHRGKQSDLPVINSGPSGFIDQSKQTIRFQPLSLQRHRERPPSRRLKTYPAVVA